MERQQLQFNYNSALLKTKIEMQEQALQFVSQEIHDNVGQVLSFSCLQLSNLRSAIPDPDSKAVLVDNLELIRQSVKELRLLSHSLNTTLIEKRDLEDVIESELSRIRAFSPIKCELKAEGHSPELAAETRLLIFRIIQEALQNVVKHANASSVEISLLYEPTSLVLSIKDDGKGIDTTQLHNNTTSVGMANMHQRATLLHGNLEVTPNGKQGTAVTLKIPLTN
jgi:signal transduction histidine kinase